MFYVKIKVTDDRNLRRGINVVSKIKLIVPKKKRGMSYSSTIQRELNGFLL